MKKKIYVSKYQFSFSDFPAIPFILVLGILQINNVQQKNYIGWRDNIT